MDLSELNDRYICITPFAQTLRRPVWEPPDIDITGIFELPNMEDWLKHIKEQVPDPELRCELLDVWGEYMAHREYLKWAIDAGRAAIAYGVAENEIYYEKLVNVFLVDYFVVMDAVRLAYPKPYGESMGELPFKCTERSLRRIENPTAGR